ncbi:unnamed protein product [Closterium sp. Yama58-4]|nr:unnamed protein product [Closterium sp. Yama58-4]
MCSARDSASGQTAHSPLHEFTFAELHEATGGFSDCVGEGGFGKVYRGRMVLPVADYVTGGTEMREREVAVKVTKGKQFTNKELKDFQAEVAAMSAMNHPNILKLEGVAIDMEQRPLLVYELIPLGNVQQF